MKITIIAADENRDRQKFISKPLLSAGHDVCVIKTRPFSAFLCRFIQLLFNNRPNVIVFMGVGPKELLALAFVKLTGVPFGVRLGGDSLRDIESVAASLWSEGSYLTWTKYKLYKLITKYFLEKTEAAIVVNQALVNRISKQLKALHRIFVIPQFCEGPPVIRGYSIETPVELLTVANFRFSEKAEGVIWLMDQLDQFVRRQGVAVHFRVAGAGLHLEDVANHLRKSTLADLLTVELAGFVTDLDTYYSRADILLYRSFHDATPNVILESKRHGLPLLVNDCEEFRTLVEHGVSGLLYRDAAGFFAFLEQLLAKQDLRERLGHGALHDHETKFSVMASQEMIEAALLEIINH